MTTDIFKPRLVFAPAEYPELEEMFMEPVQSTYWVHKEVNFDKDVQDFYVRLNSTEKYIVGTILKTFAMTEVFVADEFWGVIANYLPKPEISMLAATFTENEWRHASAYNRLNEVLGLTDFEAFLEDPIAMQKFENLTKIGKDHKGNPSKKDVAKTLAIFGAFTENVCLFSQFAILRSFSNNGRNLLTNVGDIIDWSQFDEAQHAKAAIYIFNIIKKENPEIWTDEFKSDIYMAAHLTFDIETKMIDQIFIKGELVNLKKFDLINYMKDRINNSLKDLGLKPIFDVDEETLKELNWFEERMYVQSHKDFFAKRVTDYSKSLITFDANSVFVPREKIKKHA